MRECRVRREISLKMYSPTPTTLPPDALAPEGASRFALPEDFDSLIGTGESILQQFQDLGLSTHAVMGGVFVGGRLLGGKSLRIGFGLLGMLVGAMVGLIVPAMIGYDTPALIVAVTGAALGLMIGLVALRFTVAWTMAVLLGVLGLIGTAAYFEVNPDFAAPSEVEVAEDGTLPEWIYREYERLRRQAESRLPGEADQMIPTIPEGAFPDDPEARERYEQRLEAAREGARKLNELVQAVRERLRPTWEQLTTREKGTIIAVALAGNLLGFGIGMLATKKSAILITAFAGPLIWVPAAIWLGAAFGLPGLDHLPTKPWVWGVVWIGLSVLGLVIQWRRPKQTTDKSG